MSNGLALRKTLQAMRAILLASATASLFLCNRSDAVLSHAPKHEAEQAAKSSPRDCGRIDPLAALRADRHPRSVIRGNLDVRDVVVIPDESGVGIG